MKNRKEIRAKYKEESLRWGFFGLTVRLIMRFLSEGVQIKLTIYTMAPKMFVMLIINWSYFDLDIELF